MNSLFETIYYFEGPALIITEIKRLDLSGIADDPSISNWFYYDKQTSALLKLLLRATDSSSVVQERYFEQGYLKFSASQATFIEKFNSAQFSLENKTGKDYHNELTGQITAYLK